MPKTETSLMDAAAMNAALLEELRKNTAELRSHLHALLQHAAPPGVRIPEGLRTNVLSDMLFSQLDGYVEELARARDEVGELRAKLTEAEAALQGALQGAEVQQRELLEAAARDRSAMQTKISELEAELGTYRAVDRAVDRAPRLTLPGLQRTR